MLAGLMLSVVPGQREASMAIQAERQYDPRRVAVLFLDDLTSDRHLEHLAAGITADLIDQLDEVDGLEVIPMNGVKPYRDGRVPLDSVVQRLRVGSVVAGTVQDVRRSRWSGKPQQ